MSDRYGSEVARCDGGEEIGLSTDDNDHPTCDHRDHDEPAPAVAQYEGIEPPATAFRYWTCAEHEPETLTALKRIDPGQGNRSTTEGDR